MPYWYKSGKILKKCVGSDFQSRHIRLRASHMFALYGDLSRETHIAEDPGNAFFWIDLEKRIDGKEDCVIFTIFTEEGMRR